MFLFSYLVIKITRQYDLSCAVYLCKYIVYLLIEFFLSHLRSYSLMGLIEQWSLHFYIIVRFIFLSVFICSMASLWCYSSCFCTLYISYVAIEFPITSEPTPFFFVLMRVKILYLRCSIFLQLFLFCSESLYILGLRYILFFRSPFHFTLNPSQFSRLNLGILVIFKVLRIMENWSSRLRGEQGLPLL